MPFNNARVHDRNQRAIDKNDDDDDDLMFNDASTHRVICVYKVKKTD